jgi:hypothetical protein
VQVAVQQRLDLLSKDARELITIAAVVGSSHRWSSLDAPPRWETVEDGGL